MGELEYYAQRHTHHQRNHRIKKEHSPKRMIEHRKSERQYEKDYFAENEYKEIPPLWTGYVVSIDPSRDHIPKIIKQMPLDDHHTVQKPDIPVLPTVKPRP